MIGLKEKEKKNIFLNYIFIYIKVVVIFFLKILFK
jgi:hypothetical protein